MKIEPPWERPPKVVFRPIWVCLFCGRVMIFEKGVNRWNNYYAERKTICFDCDTARYTDAVHGKNEDKK